LLLALGDQLGLHILAKNAKRSQQISKLHQTSEQVGLNWMINGLSCD